MIFKNLVRCSLILMIQQLLDSEQFELESLNLAQRCNLLPNFNPIYNRSIAPHTFFFLIFSIFDYESFESSTFISLWRRHEMALTYLRRQPRQRNCLAIDIGARADNPLPREVSSRVIDTTGTQDSPVTLRHLTCNVSTLSFFLLFFSRDSSMNPA